MTMIKYSKTKIQLKSEFAQDLSRFESDQFVSVVVSGVGAGQSVAVVEVSAFVFGGAAVFTSEVTRARLSQITLVPRSSAEFPLLVHGSKNTSACLHVGAPPVVHLVFFFILPYVQTLHNLPFFFQQRGPVAW